MKGFLDPVAWVWFGLVFLSLWLLWRRERRVGIFLVVLALGWSAFERLAVPARLLASREAAYLGKGADSLDGGDVDAVVMLGGVLMPSGDEFAGAQYLDSVDRVLTATSLALRLGKPLVMGGGTAGGAGSEREPDYTRKWLSAWGLIERLRLLDLGKVRNTRDEAVSAAAMAEREGWSRVALVTSAWHLQRSEGAFRSVGLAYEVVGCDFRGTSEVRHGSPAWLPRAESAVLLQLWLTECVGEYYYSMKGWWD